MKGESTNCRKWKQHLAAFFSQLSGWNLGCRGGNTRFIYAAHWGNQFETRHCYANLQISYNQSRKKDTHTHSLFLCGWSTLTLLSSSNFPHQHLVAEASLRWANKRFWSTDWGKRRRLPAASCCTVWCTDKSWWANISLWAWINNQKSEQAVSDQNDRWASYDKIINNRQIFSLCNETGRWFLFLFRRRGSFGPFWGGRK